MASTRRRSLPRPHADGKSGTAAREATDARLSPSSSTTHERGTGSAGSAQGSLDSQSLRTMRTGAIPTSTDATILLHRLSMQEVRV